MKPMKGRRRRKSWENQRIFVDNIIAFPSKNLIVKHLAKCKKSNVIRTKTRGDFHSHCSEIDTHVDML